jgi:hypothetical protein
MSFGQGMALSYSWKHKINTKSSTEAELVGVDDSLGYILWACYFMIEQGYDMDPSLLYQDNMSAILFETNANGRVISSKRTKHIKVKYYLIKDQGRSGGDNNRTLSNRADVDGHKHEAEAGSCLSGFQGTCHGHPS